MVVCLEGLNYRSKNWWEKSPCSTPQRPLYSIYFACRTPNRESPQSALLPRVQQASQQITACNPDRTNNLVPLAQQKIPRSNTEVSALRAEALPVSDCSCGSRWRRPPRGTDKDSPAQFESGSAQDRRFIETHVKGSSADWGPDILSSVPH